MASTENPLPGMNPFLELRWRDAHTRLITYISEALSEELPAELSVQAEEHLVVTFPDEDRDRGYFADVAVRERWQNGLPPLWQPEGEGSKVIQVAEPEIILAEPATERWLEIRDRDGKLVTTLELLSPWNKENPGREEYRRKQTVYRESRVNLVEIDLLRGGSPTVAVHSDHFKSRPGTQYIVCVSRAGAYSYEVYRCSLRDRLPAFRVPLRLCDPDVPLDLQPLIDRCYRTGRYWQLSDPSRLNPPLPPDEAEWLAERMGSSPD
jgi:hypothetical protein